MRIGTLAPAVALLCGCAAPKYVARPEGPLYAKPASPAVAHQTGAMTGKADVKLFTQSWRPKEGAPRGVLVVMHGLKDHSSRYASFAESLAARGFAVYAFDLRGHGNSEGRRVWVDEFDDYVDDLDAFFRQVRAAEPGRPVFVLGHSMGGAIVTLWALEKKPDASGLVLSAPALTTEEVGGGLKFFTKVFGAVTPRLAVFELKDEDFSRDPAVVASMKSDPLVYDGNGPAHTAAELLRAIDRIDAHMAELTLPLLDLHGSLDKVTEPGGSKLLVEKAASQDKRLAVYDGLVHDLLHEPEREKVVADVTAWLEAHTAAPQAEAPAQR